MILTQVARRSHVLGLERLERLAVKILATMCWLARNLAKERRLSDHEKPQNHVDE
jgi:uncharacterized protein YaeQ